MKVEKVKHNFKPIKKGTSSFSVDTGDHHVNAHFIGLFNGKKGSGKSFMMTSMLQWMMDDGVVDRVILVSMTAESNHTQFKGLKIDPDDVFDPMDPNVVGKLIQIIEDERDDLLEWREKMKVYREIRRIVEDPHFAIEHYDDIYEILMEFYDPETRKWKPPKHRWNGKRPHIVICLDDVQSCDILKPRRGNNILNMAIKHRHLAAMPDDEPSIGCSLCICVQNYTSQGGSLPKAIRGNAGFMCLFKTKNRDEIDLIKKEFSGEIDPEAFDRLYNYVFEELDVEYPSLWIDLHPKKSHPSQFRLKYTDWIIMDENDLKTEGVKV